MDLNAERRELVRLGYVSASMAVVLFVAGMMWLATEGPAGAFCGGVCGITLPLFLRVEVLIKRQAARLAPFDRKGGGST